MIFLFTTISGWFFYLNLEEDAVRPYNLIENVSLFGLNEVRDSMILQLKNKSIYLSYCQVFCLVINYFGLAVLIRKGILFQAAKKRQKFQTKFLTKIV